MQYLDFMYDGSYLSDYGFIICDFDADNNAKAVNIGSEITFNKISHVGGEKFTLSGTQYDDCIETSFDICKNPDIYEYDEMEITLSEYRELMRWLNRRSFFEFSFLDSESNGIYYNASFNIQKITINDRLFGLRLSMVTDSPFAHGAEVIMRYQCSGASDIKTINCESDDIGFVYPVIEIDCLQAGNLTIYNQTNNEMTYIKGVSVGERIVMDSFYQTITTTRQSHKIFNDFNYVFFSVMSDVWQSSTKFYASLNCNITVRYCPKIKATL